MSEQQHKVETLAGTNYVLRPIYDEVIAELGTPPLGFPEECKFKWPKKSVRQRNTRNLIKPQKRFVYVDDASELGHIIGDLGDDVVVIDKSSLRTDSVQELIDAAVDAAEKSAENPGDELYAIQAHRAQRAAEEAVEDAE